VVKLDIFIEVLKRYSWFDTNQRHIYDFIFWFYILWYR
jgi:hypothetical protein